MTDPLGRHGTGVGFTEYGVRDVLIFDPRPRLCSNERAWSSIPGRWRPACRPER
jgi:hypothetical protein